MATIAQSQIQDTVHPLLRHPRPIRRDPAKAQRMLSLVADSEAKALQRERSKTTRWLERPMYGHLEASDVDLEREDEHIEQSKANDYGIHDTESDSELLDRWTKPDRPESSNSWSMGKTQAEPSTSTYSSVRRTPLLNDSKDSQTSTWTTTTSHSTNIQSQRPTSFHSGNPTFRTDSSSSSGSSRPNMRLLHNPSWGALSPTETNARPVSLQPYHPSSGRDSLSPFGNLQPAEQRPRPVSFATFNVRDRPNSKIASSRGLRNNNHPSFSRPMSEIAPRVVPGEHIENHAKCHLTMGEEVASPSLSSSLKSATNVLQAGEEKTKANKKSRKRWTSIPTTFKNMARRFSVPAEDPKSAVSIDNVHQMNGTEMDSNRYHEHPDDTARNSNLQGLDHLPLPNRSPLKTGHPFFESLLPPPFAPWIDAPPTPPGSLHKRKSSGLSSSMTMDSVQPQSPVTMPAQSRPTSLLSRRSSDISLSFRNNVAASPRFTTDVPMSPQTSISRRGTPSLEQTCIKCKSSKPPSEFLNRRITANCWHEPATCLQCLESWVENCIVTRGWERCSCPECGEIMASEDVGAFTYDSAFYSSK